jgi:hypothetical protein
MRMWMVPPRMMCNQHLLGEHFEIHMLMSHLRKRRSVAGFMRQRILSIAHIYSRHYALTLEMSERGMRHKTPLSRDEVYNAIEPYMKYWDVRVDVSKSMMVLASRCKKCSDQQLATILEASKGGGAYV